MQRKFILIILLALLITACSARTPRWESASLRALDPADFPADPVADITAVYTRTTGLTTEIRFDVLDLPPEPEDPQAEPLPEPTYYIAFDTSPGGTEAVNLEGIAIPAELAWDEMLILHGNECETLPASIWLFPTVTRDTIADTITVRVNRYALPESFRVQVFSTLSGKSLPADQTGVFTNTEQVQGQTRALLAFYNTFPATTPAQALRRWDGAHTGPLGERHGLKHLLQAAQSYNTPLFLLDLKNATSLSALDTVGATKQIQAMYEEGLLALPDNAYGEATEILLARNTSTAQAFGLNPSNIYYGSFPPPQNYRYTFISMPEMSLPARAGDVTLFPMPNEDESLQPDRTGLPLQLRTILLDIALNQTDGLLVLGGDLPYSTWANADMAAPALAYLAARPYIQLLDEESLATFNIQQEIELPETSDDIPAYPLYNSQGQILDLASDQLRADVVAALAAAPQNEFTTLAWDMFFALTAPTIDPRLAQLRAQYLSDVYYFIAASEWAQNTNTSAACDSDLNRDGLRECVIATDAVFAVIVSDGARLLYMFARDARGLHQIIGPSSQFESGLSDRSVWTLSLGPAADLKAIPGAFVDSDRPWQLYAPAISGSDLVFTSMDGARSKTYRFEGVGVTVTYAGQTSAEVQIALALDPGLHFAPGWAEKYKWGNGTWEVVGGLGCQLQDTGRSSGVAFSDSAAQLSLPEDPNYAYPTGHFLPYPLAVLKREVSVGEIALKCAP